MPPACGVGITSIARQGDLEANLKLCSHFHKSSNCSKPSQKPQVTKVRDAAWRDNKKPELFFDSRRVVAQAVVTKRVSSTASACAGGSTYVDTLMRQMGN